MARTREVDGHTYDTYDNERYWQCGEPGEIDVEGTLMCLDHAGEQGYGPRQENWGYDPDDGRADTGYTASPQKRQKRGLT